MKKKYIIWVISFVMLSTLVFISGMIIILNSYNLGIDNLYNNALDNITNYSVSQIFTDAAKYDNLAIVLIINYMVLGVMLALGGLVGFVITLYVYINIKKYNPSKTP